MPLTDTPIHRAMSPMPGRSTFTTSAPWSASRVAAYGPVRAIDRSSTLTPARGPSLVARVVVSSPVDVMPVPPASSVVRASWPQRSPPSTTPGRAPVRCAGRRAGSDGPRRSRAPTGGRTGGRAQAGAARSVTTALDQVVGDRRAERELHGALTAAPGGRPAASRSVRQLGHAVEAQVGLPPGDVEVAAVGEPERRHLVGDGLLRSRGGDPHPAHDLGHRLPRRPRAARPGTRRCSPAPAGPRSSGLPGSSRPIRTVSTDVLGWWTAPAPTTHRSASERARSDG